MYPGFYSLLGVAISMSFKPTSGIVKTLDSLLSCLIPIEAGESRYLQFSHVFFFIVFESLIKVWV